MAKREGVDLRETRRLFPSTFHKPDYFQKHPVLHGHTGFVAGRCKALRGSLPLWGVRVIPEVTFQEVSDVPILGEVLEDIRSQLQGCLPHKRQARPRHLSFI